MLASTVPPASFTSVKPPLPMIPAPSIRLFTLVKVRLETCCWMKAVPLVADRLTVPPPLSVVLLLSPRMVLFAVAASWMVP